MSKLKNTKKNTKAQNTIVSTKRHWIHAVEEKKMKNFDKKKN